MNIMHSYQLGVLRRWTLGVKSIDGGVRSSRMVKTDISAVTSIAKLMGAVQWMRLIRSVCYVMIVKLVRNLKPEKD